MMLKSKKLSKYKKIRHGFFNREGGVSKGIYKSLNCGLGSKDKIKDIRNNLEKVCKRIGCNKNNLILLNQIHSKIVHNVSKIPKKKLKGDSIITNKKGIALGILTADCAPIFIYDPINNFISAIHAGWKSAYKKIITITLKKLALRGSNFNDLIAIIGPCIGKNSYEVDNRFFRKFISKSRKNKVYFREKNKIKKLFDLRKFVTDSLVKQKVKIDQVNYDTFKDSNNFFSYRRSVILQQSDYGRCISVITLV